MNFITYNKCPTLAEDTENGEDIVDISEISVLLHYLCIPALKK